VGKSTPTPSSPVSGIMPEWADILKRVCGHMQGNLRTVSQCKTSTVHGTLLSFASLEMCVYVYEMRVPQGPKINGNIHSSKQNSLSRVKIEKDLSILFM